MIAFPARRLAGDIDTHRGAYGVEPICRVLPATPRSSPKRAAFAAGLRGIAPSTYHEHVARQAGPSRLPSRAKRDAELRQEVQRVFDDNLGVHGVRKVWRQLRREGVPVTRCTAARLMRGMGLAGVIRGKPVRTTAGDKAAPCPLDRANRQFQPPAPNMLWVVDFTYVATSAFRAAKAPGSGFAYMAFVVDAYARRVVGWRVSRSAHAGFVLDALEQALHERRPVGSKLIHHSDRGSQCVCMKYSERLAEAGIEPSVGSVGDSHDNALAETINGLFKAEAIHRCGPWRSMEAVEFATLTWVDWFNNRRLLEPIGYVLPAKAETNHYAALDEVPLEA